MSVFDELCLEDLTVIDVHQHLGASWLGMFDDCNIEANVLVGQLDRFCINRAVVSSLQILCDITKGNDDIIAGTREYPDRLIPFMVVSPRLSNAVDEIDRCAELGMKGIKLHPAVGEWRVGSHVADPIFRRAEKYNLPVKVHSGSDPYSNPREIAEMAGRFPDVKIILAHMGGQQWMDAIEAAVAHPNIYLDTADHVGAYEVLAAAVREVGADRILFGSDAPELNLAAELAKVVYGQISTEAKHRILGLNALSLFGL